MSGDQQYLFRYLADELKLPLIQIARTAELAETSDVKSGLRNIETAANNALKLIDDYLMVATLKQRQLAIQPVSVTAVLYDVLQELSDLAKLYDTRVQIDVQGATGRAMANKQALKAALTGLAYTFLTSGARVKKPVVTLWARQSEDGVSAGVLSRDSHISSEDLEIARAMYGRAQRPANGITQNSGFGLFVADNLFDAMDSSLRVVKSNHRSGLAATMTASHQLALL